VRTAGCSALVERCGAPRGGSRCIVLLRSKAHVCSSQTEARIQKTETNGDTNKIH
jgi:hypothetical protein